MYFISPPFGNYLNLEKCMSIGGSYTLHPRPGLMKQIWLTLRYNSTYGGWTNKIGLRNKGIHYGLQQNNDITSIAILSVHDIPQFLSIIPQHRNIEINISCPNLNKDLIDKDIHKFLNPQRQWCILKLSPLCKQEKIDEYYKMGFRQFHCSNTIPIHEGGLSGKSIMSYNEFLIPYIKQFKDTTIIGGGGITSYKEIEYYKKLGAHHYSFSSVCFCPYLFYYLYKSL